MKLVNTFSKIILFPKTQYPEPKSKERDLSRQANLDAAIFIKYTEGKKNK